MNYKVGDRVTYKDDFSEKGEIIELLSNGKVKVATTNFGVCTENPLHLELVETQYTFTSKFNIGDKVVNLDGDIQTIKSIAFWKNYIEYLTVDNEYFLESKLELYKEPITYTIKIKDASEEQLEAIRKIIED